MLYKLSVFLSDVVTAWNSSLAVYHTMLKTSFGVRQAETEGESAGEGLPAWGVVQGVGLGLPEAHWVGVSEALPQAEPLKVGEGLALGVPAAGKLTVALNEEVGGAVALPAPAVALSPGLPVPDCVGAAGEPLGRAEAECGAEAVMEGVAVEALTCRLLLGCREGLRRPEGVPLALALLLLLASSVADTVGVAAPLDAALCEAVGERSALALDSRVRCRCCCPPLR